MLRATAAVLLLASTLVAVMPGTASAAGATPRVTLSVPSQVMIGAPVPITLTFSNAAVDTVGYGPYADLYLPTTGADGTSGGGPDDGISFLSASYLGTPVGTTELTLACNGTDLHPLTGRSVVCPAGFVAGDSLTVFELPFGSFAPNQPAAAITVSTQLSGLADAGRSLPLVAGGGFRYGSDPLDNPGTDPPVTQTPLAVSTVTPTLLTITKTSDAPEEETATGPNFPRRWTLSVTVAPGQTLRNLRVNDVLPDNVVYEGVTGLTPSDGTVIVEPSGPGPHGAGDGDIVVEFPSVSGSASYTVNWWVPRSDANAAPVLPAVSGSGATVANHGSAVGDWTPLDPRDPGGPANASVDPPAPLNTVAAKSIATQKSVAVIDDVGATGPSPGDTLAWTIRVQVSDYFAFENLRLAERFNDGQSLDTTFTPRISINVPEGAVSDLDLSGHLSVDVNGASSAGGCATVNPGSTSVEADLAGALAGALPTSTGIFTGGATGGTTATLVFRTVIDSRYRCLNSGEAVNSRDDITNALTVGGDVWDTTTRAATGGSASDTSAASVTVVAPALAKSVYAINGDTARTGPQITAGDIVTYRLRTTLPITNMASTSLTDYLPLPTFGLPGGTDPLVDRIGDGPVAPGPFTPTPWSVSLGPTDTLHAVAAGPPAISSDATQNSVTVTYPDYQAAPGTTSVVTDLLLSVVASDQPFADGLFLTNQARLTYDNSFSTTAALDSIIQVQLTEPVLSVTKGIVASNNPAAVFQPTPVGPGGVTWSTPGSTGARFTGAPITSAALAASPITADVSGVDAGDIVTFAVVVENTGSGLKGAFDVAVADALPAGLVQPTGGWNLNVTNGNGSPLPLEPGSDLFGAGIKLVDDGSARGSISPYGPGSGTNLAVITFDAQLAGSTSIAQTLTNQVAVTGYAGIEGGQNFVTSPLEDTTQVRTADPALAKALIDTSQGGGTPADVVISQVYGGGGNAGATLDEDFIELFNRGGSPQNLTGWTIQYAAATGTIWSPPGTNTLVGTIAAGQRFLVAVPTTGTTGAPLPSTDGTWGGLGSGGLAAASGKVALVSNTATLPNGSCPTGASVVSAVGYGTQNCAAISVASGSALSATQSALRTPTRCSTSFTRITPPQPQNSATAATPCGGPAPPPDPNVPVGSTVRYRVTMTVPEGATTRFGLTDTLDPGLAFVSFDSISTSSPALSTSMSGGFPGVLAGAAVTGAGTGPTAPGRTATIDFGTISNTDADNATAETVTITYTAVVLNASANVAGATRNNSVRFQVNGVGVGPTAQAADVVVTEPNITVAKAADTSAADAGDVVTYTITVTAASSGPVSTAHDVTLTDPLPPGVTYLPNTFAHTGGIAPTTLSGVASPVGATWTALQPGQSSTFTLQGVVAADAASSGPTAQNTATVAYTSLAGPQGASLSPHNPLGVERTGDTADVGGAANTYLRTGTATVTVNTSAITKALAETSSPSTTGSQVTIGEVATYGLDVTLPEGRLGTVIVTDLLPAGLSYVDGSATVDLTGFDGTFTGSPVLPTPTVVGGNVVFTFADVAVASGPGTSDNTFRITLDAIVDDVSGNTAGSTLTNRARVTVAGTQFNAAPVDLSVATPQLSIVKSFAPASAAANDTVTVTIDVTNTGSSVGWDSTVSDLVDGSTFTGVTPGSTPAGWTASTTPSGNDTTIAWSAGPGTSIGVGGKVTFSFTATVVDDVVAPGSHLNVATASTTSLAGVAAGERTVTAQGDASLDLTAVDLEVSKLADVTTAAAGERITYTITVRNAGGRDATGITLTDVLGANVEFVSASGTSTHSNGVIDWAPFDLAAGATTTRTVVATAADPMPADATVSVNTAEATDDGTHGRDPTPLNNTGTATVILGSVVDLDVTKTDGVDTARPGNALTYTITATNLGGRNAESATVVDTLDPNLVFSSASGGGIYDPMSRTITWSGVNLQGTAGMNTATFTVTATVRTPLPAGVVDVTNTVEVSHPEDVNPDNNSDTDVDTVDGTVDLGLTKTDGVDTAVAGDTLTYTIVATNTGNRGASGVAVVDTLDAHLEFVAASGGGTYDPMARTVTWDVGTLEVGATVTRTVSATVRDPLPADVVTVLNTATATDDGTNGPEADPRDNSATDITRTGADLVVTKAFEGNSLTPGSRATYVITVTNQGPARVPQLLVDDTLPVWLTNPNASVDRGVIDVETWVWRDVDLGVGQTAELRLTVDVSLETTGDIANTVTVTAPGIGDPTPANNTATDTKPVVPVVGLSITKELEGTLIRGLDAAWNIDVTNLGPSRASGVTVVDTLPATLTFVGVAGDGWVCTMGAARAVTCEAGGTFDPGDTRRLRIITSVAADASGVVTNTATVSAAEAQQATATTTAAASGDLGPADSAGGGGGGGGQGSVAIPPGTQQAPGALALTGTGNAWLWWAGMWALLAGAVLLLNRRKIRNGQIQSEATHT